MTQNTNVMYRGLAQDESDKPNYLQPFSRGLKPPKAASKSTTECRIFVFFAVVLALFIAIFLPLSLARQKATTTTNKDHHPDHLLHGNVIHTDSDTHKHKHDHAAHHSTIPADHHSGKTTDEGKQTLKVDSEKHFRNDTDWTTEPTTDSDSDISLANNSTSLNLTDELTIKNNSSTVSDLEDNTGTTLPVTVASHPGKQKTESTSVILHTEIPAKHVNHTKMDLLSALINAIYKDNHMNISGSLNNSYIREWIQEFTSQPSLEVALVGTVAAFLGLVILIISIVCLVHYRSRTSRRVRIKEVVTDLQAPDKVVLLTSDISDEEFS